MHRGREKVVVGKLARRLLPPEIAARRKQGLALPHANWRRSPAADRLRQFLLDNADRGPFRRQPLERLLRRREAMLGPSLVLPPLLVMQAWWNEFF
jgi:hypothetical protein